MSSLLSQVSLHAFIREHEIRTENGTPLDFNTHRFLFDLYADRSPFICSMKAAQIGFTTYEILKSLHEAKNETGPNGEAMDEIYVLPTAEDVNQFSGGKTNRIIANNPVFQEWTSDKDSVEQKKVGNATIYYRGSWTERAALMISARKLIVDEFDRCKQSVVEQYDSRLQHVQDPRKAFFSNPSIPEYGIHKYFELSDKKRWYVKHSCGAVFCLDEQCIDYKQEIFRCPKCQGEITDEERRMGEWYNKDGKRWKGKVEGPYEWSGWWIPLWINPMFSAQKIAAYKREKTPEYFANFVAGLPFINTNDALSQAILERNLSKEINRQEGRIIIGLDTGHNLHYTLINKEGAFYHGYCESPEEREEKDYDPYDQIEKLLIDYPHSILIADQGGDLIGVRKLQQKYGKNRVFLCWFTKETKNQQIIRWGEEKERGKVLVDRNRAVQLAVDQLNEARMVFNGTREEWQPFFDHSLNIYRVKEIQGDDENDPQYGWRWVWKRKGPDHWFMSYIYALVGLDRFATEMATVIKKDNRMSGVPTASETDGTIRGKRFLKGNSIPEF